MQEHDIRVSFTVDGYALIFILRGKVVGKTKVVEPAPITIEQGEHCPIAHITWVGAPRPALSGHAMLDVMRAAGPIVEIPYVNTKFFMVTQHEMALEVLQNPKLFPQNVHSMETGERVPYTFIPQMLNGAEHTAWRRLLAPYWSPGKIEALHDRVQARARMLIEEIAPRGECDYVKDFALRFPTAVFLEMMGLPVDQLDDLLEWETAILHPDEPDPMVARDKAMAAQGAVTQYFAQVIAERRAMAAADRPAGIVTDALDWQIDNRPVTDQELLQFYLLMFMAGLDTVTAELTYGMAHLATNPEDRKELVDHPEIVDKVAEELLRAYPIVNVPREASEDTEIGGCPIKAGQVITVSLPSVGRDENQHEDSLNVDFYRDMNTHITFGAGPHRCLGSHLARHELSVGYSEWHRLIPEYWVDENYVATESTGGLMALDSLPLKWNVK